MPSGRREDIGAGSGGCFSFCESLAADNRVLFQDKPYRYEDWETHRTWRRYIEGVSPTINLRVAVGIWPPLAINFLVCVAVCVAAEFSPWDGLEGNTAIGFPFSLTLFALSLLLVFKTNSAYSRWWEGRGMWGKFYNEIRAIVRLLYAWAPGPEHAQSVAMLVRWSVAMPYLVNAHLDPQKPLRPVMTGLLHEHELDWLQNSGHYVLAASHLMSTVLAGLKLEPNKEVTIQGHLTAFVNWCGACERIQRQAIPRAYSRHLTRFLSFWLLLLPLALYAHLKWATVAVGPLISFLLLGLEHIGAQLENPFLVLSLDNFCLTIHENVLVMVRGQQPESDESNRTTVGDIISKTRTLKQDNTLAPPPPPRSTTKTTRFFRNYSRLSQTHQRHRRVPQSPLSPQHHITNTALLWYDPAEHIRSSSEKGRTHVRGAAERLVSVDKRSLSSTAGRSAVPEIAPRSVSYPATATRSWRAASPRTSVGTASVDTHGAAEAGLLDPMGSPSTPQNIALLAQAHANASSPSTMPMTPTPMDETPHTPLSTHAPGGHNLTCATGRGTTGSRTTAPDDSSSPISTDIGIPCLSAANEGAFRTSATHSGLTE